MTVPDEPVDRRTQFLESVVTRIVQLRDATCAAVVDVELTRVPPNGDPDFPSGYTIQSPTDEQHRAASALIAEYVDSVLLVLSFLRRYAPHAAELFEQLAYEFMSYMRFQRVYSNVDMDDGPWRAQFVRECDGVVRRQILLLEESSEAFFILRSRSPLSLGTFRLTSFLDGDDRIGIHAASDLGVAVSRVFTLVPDAELERFNRSHVAQRWSGTHASNTIEALTSFGRKLADSILFGDIHKLYEETQASCEHGMRIVLDWSATPELSSYPWELMYDGSDFMALSNKSPLVRTLGTSVVSRPAHWEAPIRVLVSASSPIAESPIDVMSERNRLNETLLPLVRMGVIEIDFAPDGSAASLQRMLRVAELNGRGYHVWHHIGHGRLDPLRNGGGLVFEGADGYGVMVGGFELSTLLNNHPSLRLVVLNACHSAQPSERGTPFGIASALARRGVRTVVAMQFEISDDLARVFAEEFYLALVDGHPVEVAVTEGRRAMFLTRSYSEWASPIVIGEGDVGFATRRDQDR